MTNMQCCICENHFTQESDLIIHMETIHNLYKCDRCNYYTKQKQHLKRHKINKHSDYVKCNHCNRKFESKELLNDHIESDHQPLSCHFCDFYTRNRKALMRHIKEKHDSHSKYERKRNTPKVDQEENLVKRFKFSNHQKDIQQNEDDISSPLTSDNGINCSQVEEEPCGASLNNSQDTDSLFKINKSFPIINKHWSQLVEYRVKLLNVESTTLGHGECKVVDTNCMIEDNLNICIYLKRNKELKLLLEEIFITPKKQTVTVKLTNIDEEVKKIPKNFCVGYLIITNPQQ